MKVFVYRIGNLGDSIVALPAMSLLMNFFPVTDFVLITDKPRDSSTCAWDLYKDTGIFSEVLFYESGNLRSVSNVVRATRAEGEKMLIYLPPFRTAWQVFRDKVFFRNICGFRKTVGLQKFIGNRWIMRGGDRTSRMEKESARIARNLAAEFGWGDEEESAFHPRPIRPSDEDVRKATSYLSLRGAHGFLIGMGHGSKMPAKRWALDRYKELCRRLLAWNPDLGILLLGDAGDFRGGERIREVSKDKIVNLSGRTSVMESAAVLSMCDLYVGNDTGTMHLAAAVGLRAVAIFSARDNPGKWEPYGEGHVVLRKDVECAGCMLEECRIRKMKCLDLITVNEVHRAVTSALESPAWTSPAAPREPQP